MRETWEIRLPILPLAWNKVLSATTRERMRIRREDRERWMGYLLAHRVELPRDPIVGELSVRCCGPRRRDADGLFVKPLIDALVRLEVFEDDDCDHLTKVSLLYWKVKGSKGDTWIRIRES